MRTLICMALVFVASLSGCNAVTAGRKMLQLPGGEGTAAPSYHCTVPAEPCPRCPIAADVTDQQTKLAAQFVISHLNELSQGKKSDVALMSITEASQQVLDGTHFCIVMVACSRSAVTGVVGIHAAIHLDLRRQYQLTSYQQFTFPPPAAAATVRDAAADNSAAAERCSAYAPRADVNGERMVVDMGQGSTVLQCAVPDTTDDPMPCAGCPASVDTRDADLVAAAAFAVQEINSNQGWATELVRIKQATSQVVAGMKYCMVLVLRENGTMPFPVQTSVWWQPWSDTAPYQLLDFHM